MRIALCFKPVIQQMLKDLGIDKYDNVRMIRSFNLDINTDLVADRFEADLILMISQIYLGEEVLHDFLLYDFEHWRTLLYRVFRMRVFGEYAEEEYRQLVINLKIMGINSYQLLSDSIPNLQQNYNHIIIKYLEDISTSTIDMSDTHINLTELIERENYMLVQYKSHSYYLRDGKYPLML